MESPRNKRNEFLISYKEQFIAGVKIEKTNGLLQEICLVAKTIFGKEHHC